jgi:hypothetical protein
MDDLVETRESPGGFSFRDERGCFKKPRDLGVFLKKRRGRRYVFTPEVSLNLMKTIYLFCFWFSWMT